MPKGYPKARNKEFDDSAGTFINPEHRQSGKSATIEDDRSPEIAEMKLLMALTAKALKRLEDRNG